MATARQNQPKSLRRRFLLGLLIVLGLVLVLYLLLSWAGLRLTRAANPIRLSGSELKHSRVIAPKLAAGATRPANLIVFIADGLGFAHLSAARAALHGMGSDAVWDRFTTTGWHQPHSATGFLVDSAASATALATGVPTHVDRIGMDVDAAPLANLFERGRELGYRGGIVTDSYIWDATPAAFATHAVSRDDAASILEQLAAAPLEILVGEVEDLGESEGGYRVPAWQPTLAMLEKQFRVFGPDALSTAEFLKEGSRGGPVAAIFDEDQITDLDSNPTLPQLLSVALARLGSDTRPFILMVESEEVDSASHTGDFERLLRGMEAIEAALALTLDFADQEGRTLVVFTSDHETGGLALSVGDKTNSSLRALWPTRSHSGVVVPVLARGPGAEHFGGMHATWEIGRLLGDMLKPAGEVLAPPEALAQAD